MGSRDITIMLARWWRTTSIIHAIPVSLVFLPTSYGSNWAQIAGERVQNYAIPYEDRVARPLFSSRAGMALTTTNTTPDSEADWGYLHALGGDSFVKTTDENLGERGGGYMNDVWVSEGAKWEMYYEGSKPMARSTMNWDKLNPGRVPPAGVTYETWIVCQEGLRYRLHDESVCDEDSTAPGSYKAENMWSPRRNHRAVSIDDRIFVLGGRAREISDMAQERTVGGLLSPRLENDPFYSTWHEPSVLKNDVWASEDQGKTWFMVSPGCHCPQAEDVLAGNAIGDRYSSPENACSQDSDCYGAGQCVDIGGAGRPTCVCPMWSPRELHAAAVHNGVIYVVGGVISVRKSKCGNDACGDVDAGAYRGFKSDVWYSLDGARWKAATPNADWPGRGDHGIFIHSSVIYVVGGAVDGGNGRMEYMNDVWQANLPKRRSSK